MYFTDAIREHALKDAPNEACGLIYQESGEFVYRPAENVWETPPDAPESDRTRFFRIDTKVVQKALKTKALAGVAHSHTHTDEAVSETDKHVSNALGLPFYIYSTVTDKFSVYQPEQTALPLLGRPYVPLVHDCFSLASEYIATNLDVEVPFMEHTVEESLRGKTADALAYATEHGWKHVNRARPFDVVVMNVKCHNFPNHLGVIMADGVHLLHHLYQRKSETHPYGGYWKKATMMLLRHPKFFVKNV